MADSWKAIFVIVFLWMKIWISNKTWKCIAECPIYNKSRIVQVAKIRRQAIARASGDQDLWRHVVSPGDNEFIHVK